MKWDKKNKERLKDVLWNKALMLMGIPTEGFSLALQDFVVYGPSDHRDWNGFLDSLGIKRVKRKGRNEAKSYSSWTYECGRPAQDRKRIIVRDTFFFRGIDTMRHGLSIPKDVAEKFLVLGIP